MSIGETIMKYTWPRTDIHSLLEELSRTTRNLDIVTQENIRLRNTNTNLKNSNRDLSKKLETLATETEKLLAEKNRKKISAESKLKEKEEEVRLLKKDNGFLRNKNKEIEEHSSSLLKKNETLVRNYNQLKQFSEQLCQNKDKQISEEKNKFREYLSQNNIEKATLAKQNEEKVSELEKKIENLNSSLEESDKRLVQEKEKGLNYQKLYLQSKSDMSANKDVIDYWKKQNSSLQELVKEQSSVNVEQGHKYLESEMKNQTLQKEINSLKKKNEDLLKMFYILQEFYSTLLENDYNFSEIRDVKVKPDFLKSLKNNKIHIPQDIWLKMSENKEQEKNIEVVLDSSIVHYSSDVENKSKLGNKILFGLLLFGALLVLYWGFQI